MSLIVYECQRADHGHEIRQFQSACQSLYEYFDGRDELAVFIGNINIGSVNLDGLIVKNDAIIIVEFKDYEGDVFASQNYPWTCNDNPIKGGSGNKTVYNQLNINKRELRTSIASNKYFSEAQRNDIKGIVVFTKLKSCRDDFERKQKAWVFISDIENIGNKMHEIIAADWRDNKTGKTESAYISNDDIFNFLRKIKIQENSLITDFTDTTVMPEDLYNEDHPHNGKYKSTASLLKKSEEENASLKQKMEEQGRLIAEMKNNQDKVIHEKDAQILEERNKYLLLQAEKNAEREKSIEAREAELKSSAELEVVKREKEEIQRERDELRKNVDELQQKIDEFKLQSNKETKTAINVTSKNAVEMPAASADVVVKKTKKRLFGVKERVLKTFDVKKEDITDGHQLDLIDRELEHSMIVAGCAGSGKSVIAMYKAQQIIEEGGDVILIAYTKSLNRYMQQGKQITNASQHFYYHWEWKKEGKPSADYIIVDEIQDFEENEINDFIKAANKCFFFFGDSAQSIYHGLKKTVSVEKISEMTGVKISLLQTNYRLPKPVAKITQSYVGVDVPKYADAIYQSKETDLPHFISFSDNVQQMESIIDIIERNHMKNVGILVPTNDDILKLSEFFYRKKFACEAKYNAGDNETKNRDSLNFSSEFPKIMTYHSAKGLQFETVILPFYKGADNDDDRRLLYVAMTRTYRFLYVLYNGTELLPPLKVDGHLYQKK